MIVAVIGATGFVGSKIVDELLHRNHRVLAISRNIDAKSHVHLTKKSVDVNNSQDLSEAIEGANIVISAFNAGWQNPEIYDHFIKGANAIQEAVKKAGIDRYIVIGGAGSLYVSEHVQVVDTPDFPKEIHAGASAARDYLNVLKKETHLDWVFFCPPFEMHPGITVGRTGKYRLGTNRPLFDEAGRSRLSVEDVAVVIADEIEQPKHHRERFTAAY